MLELLLALQARGGVPTVVTFDNGEFNAPLFTPRWNGRWRQPSVAQEIATSVARVTGENPVVYTYLPPGQAPARPGEVFRVEPVKPGCAAPAVDPADPCWCTPADNCWSNLQPSWFPGASTSLFLSARSVRATVAGPRVEVHFTDLFEEDPTAAEDPSDTDRCVTRAGVRRAVQALLRPVDGESLDHLAVGLLRATVDPPPPGASWGFTYGLGPGADGDCHSGAKSGEWNADRGPLTMTFAVIVLGLGTAHEHAQVSALLDGLAAQLGTGRIELEIARLREPPGADRVARVVDADDMRPLVLAPRGPAGGVPCGTVTGRAELASGGVPVPVAAVRARCDGMVEVDLTEGALLRAHARQAGLDPRVTSIALSGVIRLEGDADALAQAYARLDGLADSDRPLPLLGALGEALTLGEPGPGAWQPWTRTIEVDLRVSGLDGRPWLVAVGGGTFVGLLAGLAAVRALRALHGDRALRRHWEASLGRDPLLQLPLAVVIGRAQEEVSRGWPLRSAVSALVAGAGGLATIWIVLAAWRVMLG